MNFTGINYRSLPSSRQMSANIEFSSISYSGDKYNANLASGVHFGFSGTSDNISFLMRSGKIYDPENRVVYSYSEGSAFSLFLNFNSTNYSYAFNGQEYCSNGVKNNFAVNKFFFNSNGLTCDVTANIYGPEVNYSVAFPETYSSSSLTGTFTNSSSFDIKIFSAEITSGNSLYYSTAGISNITVSANSSSNITLTDLVNTSGIFQSFVLTLYTNFGAINININTSRI